jgi:hypothetical protein
VILVEVKNRAGAPLLDYQTCQQAEQVLVNLVATTQMCC